MFKLVIAEMPLCVKGFDTSLLLAREAPQNQPRIRISSRFEKRSETIGRLNSTLIDHCPE